MTTVTTTRKFLLLILIGLVVLVGLAAAMSALHSANGWDHTLVLFDEDLSNSVIGWMIAIPILIFAIVVTVAVLAGVGLLLTGVIAMALVLALLTTIFGIFAAVLPIAALIVVPLVIVWAIIKLASRKPVSG